MHIPYAPAYMLATRGTQAGKEALLYGETLSPDRYKSLYKHLGVQSMLVRALLESGSWLKAQLGAVRDLSKFRCRWLVLGPRWSPRIGTACSRCQPLPPIVLVPSDSTLGTPARVHEAVGVLTWFRRHGICRSRLSARARPITIKTATRCWSTRRSVVSRCMQCADLIVPGAREHISVPLCRCAHRCTVRGKGYRNRANRPTSASLFATGRTWRAFTGA